jgi:carbonic anhydrase
VVIIPLVCISVALAAAAAESSLTADQALKILMDGNTRFVTGDAAHPNQSQERLAETVSAQHPIAAIVSCSDSRVSPEIVFDQGVGDIFIVRTAGEVMDDAALGSLEYAVEHLGVPMVMVIGHDGCGAVNAAVKGGEAPGHISALVDALTPSVEKAKSNGEDVDLLNRSIDINTQSIVSQLKSTEPILSEAVEEGKLKIAGARYHLDNGKVTLMG